MRAWAAAPPAADPSLTDAVLTALRGAGLESVGVASAEPFTETHETLLRRRREGLHAGMAFTYLNPARSTDPGRIVESARSVVSGALDYLRAPPDASADVVVPGRVARYAWTDTYAELHEALRSGTAVLRDAGYQAVIVIDQNSLVDREAASRAGVGWYGRNANLLLPGRGSWFVLGAIVTDAHLVRSDPAAPGCGTCTRCGPGCPTGAIVGPGVVDANRCLSWLLQAPGVFPWEWRVVLGDRIYGCDDCQEVCPPNAARGRADLRTAPHGARAVVDVSELLDDDDAAVMAAAGRWYVAKREARYLRRNALIVLGNAGDADDPRVISLVERALLHQDALVRAHAVWAAARLGRPDLADRLESTEADAMVLEELHRRAEVAARMSHLLVTNDFPPKMGGIQTYLWELWRRIPPDEFTVLTTQYPGSETWDRNQAFHVERLRDRVLLPRPGVIERIRQTASRTGAKLVVLDPALPLGLVGPSLDLPYAVVIHGAEVTVPGRLPLLGNQLGRVLAGARGIVAAARTPRAEAARAVGGAERLPETVDVPPGVDLARFRPLGPDERRAARRRLGLPEEGPLVVSASRLVPRKGMDVLIEAMPRLVPHRPDLTLAIAGGGRDLARLQTLVGRFGLSKRVRFLGRVPEADLADLYASADLFAMLCRNRWWGLEQEGFGIVFLEAAASGVAQIAGASGGAADAVVDGLTGIVVQTPEDAEAVADAVIRLLADSDLRGRMATAGRKRAEDQFCWNDLASTLLAALRSWTP